MASTSRLLLLRRGDHDSRLTEGFESLLDMECMTDVSITCGQQIVKAHRTVLSIFSPFFKRVFDSIQNPMHYPFIVLKDMPYADLRAIIDLMYRGEVTVAQDQFASLKKSAKTLEVSELSDIISSYEEKNDIKPKLEDNNSNVSRNTRKRGRPKRYCEESDEEFKVFQTTPPTKRQQVLQTNRTAQLVKKPFVQTIAAAKPQTATRGGANLTYTRQPTAVRGGHSAFQRPQTATRGGHAITLAKPQIATRGTAKASPRGRGVRYVQNDESNDTEYLPQLTSARRARRGRPPRTSTDTDLPLGTSLPVSLPEPIQVDLGNIFPNYNLNDVTSSTSNVSNVQIPVTFETTIKREPDSDSEVECIMSGTSPLPSGVIEDNTEQSETLQTSCNEVSTNSNTQTIDSEVNERINDNNEDVVPQQRDSVIESATNETAVTSEAAEPESNVFETDIVIKTERPDSPITESQQISEQTKESAVSSVRRDSVNLDSVDRDINIQVISTTTASQPERPSESVTTMPTIISLNSESRNSTNVSIIRFIKTERISPPPVVQTSFQSIAFSATTESNNNLNETNDYSNSSEIEISSESIVPVLSRVKIERISPNNTDNSVEEISQTATDESAVVTSSRNKELAVEITNVCSNQSIEEPNEVEITHSVINDTVPVVKVERQSPTPTQDILTQELNSETVSENIECTSSSGQQLSAENPEEQNQQNIIHNTEDDNIIDVQDIAFDCFYSNDDQQMQTFGSDATTSSTTITSSDVNALLGLNTIEEDINSIHQNNHQIITSSDLTQQTINETNCQIFALNASQEMTTNTTTADTLQSSNTYSLDNNNVVMNSPMHSDEECMLLDSPQQPGYEVTIGSEANLDDSMDDNL